MQTDNAFSLQGDYSRSNCGLADDINSQGKDLYVYECTHLLREHFGVRFAQWSKNTALMMFKPDAIVGRRGHRILSFCEEHGFYVKSSAVVKLNRHSMREIWRFDWQIYPIERLSFSTLWYTANETIAILFEQDDTHPEPASMRLGSLKGGAHREYPPGSLRASLNPPNKILNFVHIADHPLDVVREIGILFDDFSRANFMLKSADRNPGAAVSALLEQIAKLEGMYPAHDLAFEASLGRLQKADLIAPQHAQSMRMLKAHQRFISFADMHAYFDIASAPPEHVWDMITSLSYIIQPEISQPTPYTTNDPPDFSTPQHR